MSLSTFDSLFKSDEDKSKNGVPIEFGFNSKNEKVTLFIAEAGNPNHEKAQRKYAKALENSRKNKELYNEIICKIVAESILLKWEGVLDNDGEPMEATFETKFDALKRLRKLFLAVLDAASDASNFSIEDAAAAEAESEKN
jgi:hypothetical protein